MLLVLGGAVGALAFTATPAHAATSILACFQRPANDPFSYTVRWDLRVWNSTTRVWQSTGQSLWATISNKQATCQVLFVPTAYQNFSTTVMVDYVYVQNGTWMKWYGWSGEAFPPGTWGYRQRTTIAYFTVGSSADGLNVHYDYWH